MGRYNVGMAIFSYGYDRTRETVERIVTLAIGAVLTGWILYSAPRDVADKADAAARPEVSVVSSGSRSQRDMLAPAELKANARVANQSVPVALTRKPAAK